MYGGSIKKGILFRTCFEHTAGRNTLTRTLLNGLLTSIVFMCSIIKTCHNLLHARPPGETTLLEKSQGPDMGILPGHFYSERQHQCLQTENIKLKKETSQMKSFRQYTGIYFRWPKLMLYQQTLILNVCSQSINSSQSRHQHKQTISFR